MASTVLIDENGVFNTRIERYLDLASESRPPAVVSIIGAQSSGKSTLLNHLFRTDFEVMNQANGMSQTTKGIWVAKYPSPRDGSPILVIDTEGSDGSEREDDLKFEKQTALFSLAVSNTVMINMKCDNANHNNGGGRALLRAVLEVMLRRFETPRKVNLVFVLRDRNEVPLGILKTQLVDAVGKIWKDIIGHQSQVIPPLEHYFQIEVVTMSHYRQMDFDTEVDSLREQIMFWTASGERSRETIGASGFAAYAETIWDVIKKDKDLDLPRERIMVSQVRCKAIADEKYKSFLEDETWRGIKKQVAESPEVVVHFGQGVSSIRKSYLDQYDEDAHYFHHTHRDEYKKRLTEKLMEDIEPNYRILVDHIFQATLKEFLDAAEEEINKDTALDNMKTERYKTKMHEKLEDAAIEGADPDYANNQIALLMSTMDTVIAKAALVIKELVITEMMKGKNNVWKKIAIGLAFSMSVAISAGVIGAAVASAPAAATAKAVAMGFSHSTLGAAIARQAPALITTLSHTTVAVIKALREENPEAVQNLADFMASIVSEASKVKNTDCCCPSSSAA